jgi:hypothetical protein
MASATVNYVDEMTQVAVGDTVRCVSGKHRLKKGVILRIADDGLYECLFFGRELALYPACGLMPALKVYTCQGPSGE